MKKYRIVMLGAGNVGFQLACHLRNNGQHILQVFSRHLSATWNSTLRDIPFTKKISEIEQDGDIYLIAVKDDAIKEIIPKLFLPDKIVAHTSASIPMDILSSVTKNYGVFYPLQTISKNISLDFSAIPICFDAANKPTLEVLKKLAHLLSKTVVEINDDKRLAIHVAAVFANNFSNHLFSIAQEILMKNNLSFDILKPLIRETIRKIETHNPNEVQTGPAARNDEDTINRHLEFLNHDEQLMNLYRLMTTDIQTRND
ncbi:MAG: DUF2520 domain-containing protein [Chitinophagales bacterium]|nr:DUF2520 domain-containing protein [Chitinophagales bacterium]